MLMLLCAAGCKKDKASEDQLPAATQSGANTFGCLVNGKVFVPKGYDDNGRPNPHVQYDYDLNGQAYLAIDARQFNNNISSGTIIISFVNFNSVGSYTINNQNFRYSVGWDPYLLNCSVSVIDPAVTALGGGDITKFDISNRIISGTFAFKAIKSGCDTVRVTNGRFDIKF